MKTNLNVPIYFLRQLLEPQLFSKIFFSLVINLIFKYSYCQPNCTPLHTNGTNNCTSYKINNVSFNTLNHNPACIGSQPFYFDNPPVGSATTSVNAGSSYLLSVNSGPYNSVAVWIDYNQDNNFSSDEYISLYPHYNTTNIPWTGSAMVLIPVEALGGESKMRISTEYYFAANYANSACATYIDGGMTEDYTISISAASACSGVPNPGNTISSANPVKSESWFQLSLQNNTATSGLMYQWQSSPNGTIWTNATGNSTDKFYNTSQIAATYYQCLVTCLGNTTNSIPLHVTLNPPGCNCNSLQNPGQLDVTLDPGIGPDNRIHALVVQEDGKIIIGGNFNNVAGVPRKKIARLNSDGTLDVSFDPGTGSSGSINALALQSDGKIIIGGLFTKFNGQDNWGVARLNSDGSLDQTFFNEVVGPSDVNAISIQSDGKILVGGDFFYAGLNNSNSKKLMRLNNNGSLDISFNAGITANDQITAIALQSDGKIIIGGEFSTVNGMNKDHLAQLDANGFFDPTFNTGGNGPNDIVQSISIQNDQKIIIGGYFNQYNGGSKRRIARLDANGTIDVSFNIGTGFSSQVNSTLIQCDGKIIAGGSFSSYNGTNINGISRLNSDGTIDNSFNPGTGTGIVHAIALQNDRKILVGGDFISYDGTSRKYIARIAGCLNASVTLNLKMFIQGFYTGGGMMDNSGFGGSLFLINNPGSLQSDVDTVYISIMSSVSPYNEIEMQKGILKTNGDVSVTLNNAVAGEYYYIRVVHRNSIETWSATPVLFSTITIFDFANNQSNAFGSNLCQAFDMLLWSIYSGDINRDGAIDGSDFLDIDVLIQNGDGGYAVGDLSGDGAVDGADFLLLDPNIQLGIGVAMP